MPLSPKQKDLIARSEASRGSGNTPFWETLTAEEKAELNQAWRMQDAEIKRQWEQWELAATATAPIEPAQNIEPKAAAAPQKPLSKPHRKRLSQIKVIYGYSEEKWRRWDDRFLVELRGRLGNRNPLDRKRVSDQDVGGALGLTLKQKMLIEDREDDWQRRNGHRRSDARPYRITTVAPCDATPAEVEKAYRDRRNAKRQPTEKTMHTNTAIQTQVSFDSYAELQSWQQARRREQEESIIEALHSGERTIAELCALLRRDPAWQRYADKNALRQAIVDRLRGMGRRIASRYESRPQGGDLRFVRLH